MKRLEWLLLVAMALALAPAVAAPGGAKGATVCEPLGSEVRREPLSKLLGELSAVRRFRLENWNREDPIVTHAGGSDVELMEALSDQVNLMVRYAAAKECPGRWRIAAIWVLPGQPAARGDRDRAAGRTAAPASVAPAVPSAAEVAAARFATDLYLQGHGRGRSATEAAASGPSP